MKKGILTALFLAVLLLLPGCQSNQSSPLPVTKDGIKSITISASSQTLYVGTTETFQATATMYDGTQKAITEGVWTSDLPSVATVEASTGRVTMVGAGWVLISVLWQGKEGAEFFEGVPQPQGL